MSTISYLFTIISVGDIISKHDQILGVTTGLDKEYESEFVQITLPVDLYKSSDVSALLLAHEKRIEQYNTTTTEYVMSTNLVCQGQQKKFNPNSGNQFQNNPGNKWKGKGRNNGEQFGGGSKPQMPTPENLVIQ